MSRSRTDEGDGAARVDDGAAAFEAARAKLMAIAYRMLGSVAEAEDVVGDAAERWATADRERIAVAEAWLVTVTTRRALDVLRSARLQRERYPGVWLPEPMATGGGPGDDLERVESLTMGFLVLLERLTPIERAVLVLHDALDYPYGVIAEAVGRTEPACRQALRRARQHVTVPARRTEADRAQAAAVAERFMAAGLSGDIAALLATLSPDVVALTDGGGLVHAAMRPVVGPQRVGRFIGNLARRLAADAQVTPCELNGEPGVLVHADGRWVAYVVEVHDERVAVFRAVVSPPKLERLVATFSEPPDGASAASPAGRFRHRRGRPVDH